MHRRTFLACLASASLVAISRDARAWGEAPVMPRLKRSSSDESGTTLFLGVGSAPFADDGYEDDTVIVFIPAHYQYRREEGVSVIVHFHGHFTTAEREVETYELREQLAESKQNALLIVPQLAVMAADSCCGALEAPGSLEILLVDAIAATSYEASSVLDDRPFPANAPLGAVCLSARGGGYHAAAACLRHGGVDVRETYLFDALYGDLDVFHDWVAAGVDGALPRRLVSCSTEGGLSETQSWDLSARLERARGVLVRDRQRADDVRHKHEPVFVRTSLPESDRMWERRALGGALGASQPARRRF